MEFKRFDVNVVVTVTDAVSPPVRTEALDALSVNVASPTSLTAEAVGEERVAKPSAATKASAIRLKAVEVDISFLSKGLILNGHMSANGLIIHEKHCAK